MDTKTFFLQNDLGTKIRAALEQVIVGQGFGVFKGLENGMCVVKISYDGVNIVLQNMMPNVEVKQAVPVGIATAVPVGIATSGPNDSALPEPVTDDPPNVCEETQTRRKVRHGSRNETE